MTTTIAEVLTEMEQRAARGAALLDREHPGWHTKINIATFKIWQPCGCILGQALGNFYVAAAELYARAAAAGEADAYASEAAWLQAHGFDYETDSRRHSDAEISDGWGELQDAWLTEINTRRWSARPGNLQAVDQ